MVNSPKARTQWNPLALVSFLVSLVVPVGVLVLQLAGGILQTGAAVTSPVYRLGVALLLAGTLTIPLAIVTGHSALDEARRRAYRHPLREIAIIGLVLGYGALLAYLGGIVLVYWVVSHLRLHIVY